MKGKYPRLNFSICSFELWGRYISITQFFKPYTGIYRFISHDMAIIWIQFLGLELEIHRLPPGPRGCRLEIPQRLKADRVQ